MLLEKELISECICGNRTAQKELYEKYSPYFFAICMRYMPTREDAEDVLVTGFASIFSKLDTYKEDGSFEGWMKRIIINKALTTLRINNRHHGMKEEMKEWEQDKILTSENMVYTKINTKDIMKQIQQLPAGYRVVFNLHAIEGYSYEKISNILNINKGTVSSQMAKARKILQKNLQDFK